MKPTTLPLACALLLGPATAQNWLFSTSGIEQTLSGSGGTVLRFLGKNEVAHVEFNPCPVVSAEKWGPRTCYLTMAGDENADGDFWNQPVFGQIDALVHTYIPGQVASPRNVFFSPAQPLGTAISGAPGLRPGDTGRIATNGQVLHFLSAEQVQQALGLPTVPIVVDVDAITADPSVGIFFSLDQDLAVITNCGTTFVRDGDVLMIPPNAIVWTPDQRVLSLTPGCAVVPFPEAQMDLFVQNAQIADAAGNCVPVIQDLEALDLDFFGRQFMLTFCSGSFWIPTLFFSGELMTGAGVCTTDFGGAIATRGCGPIGTACGAGATLGDQMGLLPTLATNGTWVGVQSYVSALNNPLFTERFVVEPQQHMIPWGSPVQLDVNTPLPFTVIAADISPPTVAPSSQLFPALIFTDLYILGPPPWWTWWIGPGFTTITTPNVPFPLKIVFQAGGWIGGNLVTSTPATVDVF